MPKIRPNTELISPALARVNVATLVVDFTAASGGEPRDNCHLISPLLAAVNLATTVMRFHLCWRM
jgi:hypothetical protein